MVPFLYRLMGSSGWSGLDVPLEYQAALAHATSLAVIVPAAVSGLIEFRRHGVVSWSLVVPIGASAAVAALFGAQVAMALPTPVLKLAFGIFLIATGARFLGEKRGAGGEEGGEQVIAVRWRTALVGGALVGFLSALLGVGGGLVAIPILIRWVKVDLRRVVPTSVGIIVFAATAGVLSYVVAGARIEALPAGSLGFVYLPAALAMMPGAVLMAPLGARWNQRLSGGTLRLVLAIALLAIGLQLVWENGTALMEGAQ